MAKFDADNLTDSELRSKLAEYGHPVGPVTETTRKILIKKLKLLMKQKSAARNVNRSLARFSSGDESGSDTDQNGGYKSSRRISMPPPTGYKSTKRKLMSQNCTPDSPTPSISKASCSTPVLPNNNLDFKSSRFSTPSFSVKQSQYSSFNRPMAYSTYSYDFDSGSDSDDFKILQSSVTNRKKTGSLNYGSLSSYRSKPSSNNFTNFFKPPIDPVSLRLKNKNKKESRPFFSNFVGRFSCKSGLNDALNPLDIKESDVEEDGFTDKWRNVNIGSRNFNFREWTKPFQLMLQYFRSKDHTISCNYKSRNNSQILSMLLLGLFLLFFVWLALAYFKVTQKTGLSDKSFNKYPLCNDNQQDDDCIYKKDLRYAIHLYKEVHVKLEDQGLKSVCGPPLNDGSMQKPYMTERELINFLMKTRPDKELQTLIKGLGNLKLLVWANHHWGINLIIESGNKENFLNSVVAEDKTASEVKNQPHLFISRDITMTWSCYLFRLFYKIISTVVFVIIGATSFYLIYITWNYFHKVKKEETEQVMAMVEKILDHVSEFAEKANNAVDSNGSLTSIPQDYVAIRHVHDTLIHPTERMKMSKIWQKAVKFIDECESRIRTEVQQVWGEDTPVWRWLGPLPSKAQGSPHPSNNDSENESSNQLYPDLSSLKAEAKRCSDRVWQGEAFETSEGSMNSLPSSPTQCLKIRHMFKHDKDYGPDWVLKVKDAIVEKCEGARIIHLSVDKESKEGCVYVKCASPQDAGVAYRQLHGSWFDGALVTVKYLRLERYHERFPDSVYARTPLRPSNNLRLSMQGTSS